MRLIDADLALEKISVLEKEPDYQHEGEEWRSGLYMAETVLDELPTSDIVEQIFADIDRIMNERLVYCLQLSGDKSLHSVGGMTDAYGYLRNQLPKLKKKYGVK